jgi:hypothetical protein
MVAVQYYQLEKLQSSFSAVAVGPDMSDLNMLCRRPAISCEWRPSDATAAPPAVHHHCPARTPSYCDIWNTHRHSGFRIL